MITHHDLLRPKNYNGQEFSFVQRKFDGMRILIRVGMRIEAITRDGKSDHWPMIGRFFPWVSRLPANTCLDCELYVPNEHATSVITHIVEETGKLELVAFAIPTWKGTDLRPRPIEDIARIASDWRIPFAMPRFDDRAPEALLAEARAMRWEGFVLKQGHYDGWFKLKPKQTCDLVVQGYDISTSDTHFGGLKAIKVGIGKTELASVGSGFTAEFRATVDPASLIGRVCEVEFDSLAARGKLKFPRFLRWRDDKSPQECTMEQFT